MVGASTEASSPTITESTPSNFFQICKASKVHPTWELTHSNLQTETAPRSSFEGSNFARCFAKTSNVET